jgi:glycine/D-amino acid oxidase-like deaminating enzyme
VVVERDDLAAGASGRNHGLQVLPGEDYRPPVLAGELAGGDPAPLLGALVHPNPDGTLMVGGSRQAALAGEPDDPAVPRRILARALRLVPALAEQPVMGTWWGVRPMSPDGRPIVGFLRDGLVAGGHGSQGVILGGGTARLVAALLSGEEPPFDPTPFSPERLGLA